MHLARGKILQDLHFSTRSVTEMQNNDNFLTKVALFTLEKI